MSGKKIYPTRVMAVDALIDARTRYEYTADSGPVGVYQCEDCGQFHLTSKGKMDETLERLINNGTIRLQREANRWIDKFKR